LQGSADQAILQPMPLARSTAKLTPDLLVRAYMAGVFPMAERRDSADVFWVDPRERGVLPLDGFHLPKRLARTVRQDQYAVTINTAFRAVMEACAQSTTERRESWINHDILAAYTHLHEMGLAHSVEAWHEGRLVGGLYGVSLGGAYFGESMFSRARDASKVALVHLVARLRVGGYVLLDTQFITSHLAQFGAIEVSRSTYRERLKEALATDGDFYRLDRPGYCSLGISTGAGAGAASPSAEGRGARDGDLALGRPPNTSVSGPVSGNVILHWMTQTS
jgi:leucyl/phenylalanyl-tRNA---protein transferase